MSDLTSLLASLISKEAISQGKLDFLTKAPEAGKPPSKYYQRLKDFVVNTGLVTLLDEGHVEDPDGPVPEDFLMAQEKVRAENEDNLKTAFRMIVEEVEVADPTGKQGKYVDWLLDQYLNASEGTRERWTEDAPEVIKTIKEWEAVRSTDQYRAKQPPLPAQIEKFENLAEVKALVLKFNTAESKFDLPELTGEKTTIVYQDGKYIVWQVFEVPDLMALSSFPPNNMPAWCTKESGQATRYLSTGPDYICYKDGDPFFQVDPKSNPPQFMSRSNTVMHTTDMLNKEAAEVIQKISETATNDLAVEHMAKILSVYEAPDLSKAETMTYLKKYLMVHGDAKKDPEFLALEQGFVKPRYDNFDLDELQGLCNTYPRTGEATRQYAEDNKFVARIGNKIKDCTTLKELDALKQNTNPAMKLSDQEYGFCFRLDWLFKTYVFPMFERETGWKEQFGTFKKLSEAEDPKSKKFQGRPDAAGIIDAQSPKMADDLIKLLNTYFPVETYSYSVNSGKLPGFKSSVIGESGLREVEFTKGTPVEPLVKGIRNMVRGVVNGEFEAAVESAKHLDAKGAYDVIVEAGKRFKNRVRSDENNVNVRNGQTVTKAINAICEPKAMAMLADAHSIFQLEEKAGEMGVDLRSISSADAWCKTGLAHKLIEIVTAEVPQKESLTELRESLEPISGRTTLKEMINAVYPELRPVVLAKAESLAHAMVAPLTRIKEVQEMGREYSSDGRFSSTELPSWFWSILEGKAEEIRQNTERLRQEKDNARDPNVERKTRIAPKRFLDEWWNNTGSFQARSQTPRATEPDPPTKVRQFLLDSPSFSPAEKIRSINGMKEKHEDTDAWVRQADRTIGLFEVINYVMRFYKTNAPGRKKFEQIRPDLMKMDRYTEEFYKGERIPEKETSLLNKVQCHQPLDDQITYIKKYMKGKPWAELESRVEKVFNDGKWQGQDGNNYIDWSDLVDVIADAILKYLKEVKKARWPAIEAKMKKNREYWFRYLEEVVPDFDDKFQKWLDEHEEQNNKKKSTLSGIRQLYAFMDKELERL